MTFEPHIDRNNLRLLEASGELEKRIQKAYPNARFSRLWFDDPEGLQLQVVIPITDPEEVFNLVCDELLHYQIEEGLPLYLIPLRPVGEVVKQLQSKSTELLPPQANP
jgi:hypothetical protein